MGELGDKVVIDIPTKQVSVVDADILGPQVEIPAGIDFQKLKAVLISKGIITTASEIEPDDTSAPPNGNGNGNGDEQ